MSGAARATPPAARTRSVLGSATDLVARAAKAERFTGKSGSALDLVAPAGIKASRLIVIGTGKAADRKLHDVVKLGGIAMGRIPATGDRHQDTIVFASETCAFDLVGATYEREVKPGELVIVGPDGPPNSRFYAPALPQSSCIFEHVYSSRPDSQVFGRAVQDSREQLGRELAIESPADADLVVPVPDSGVTAAMGYAAESGIPLRFGLIRNHYVGRTFIEPQQTVRDFGVKLKLNPVRSLLQGKRVVLIDDSIVRGTTSRKIVRMVRGAGAKEVHMRISCPPTISPCFYGVDTPRKNELIAANNTVEEIRRYIGADSLSYLSLEGLKKACHDGEKTTYCSACYTGKYPTNLVDIEEIQPATIEKP